MFDKLIRGRYITTDIANREEIHICRINVRKTEIIKEKTEKVSFYKITQFDRIVFL